MPNGHRVTIERVFPDGEPDVVLAGFKLWVHGRGHSRATDSWDGNWLEITSAYVTEHCIAVCEGDVLHGSDVLASLDAARRMHETLEGQFSFATLEPGFALQFSARQHGRIDLDARIVTEEIADGRGEYHKQQLIDQSYLPALINGLTQVLRRFPILDVSTE